MSSTRQEAGFLLLSEEILGRGSNLRIPIGGFSMSPFLRSGDIIIIKPANKAKIIIGDVIIRHAGQKMVAHRVIKKRRENGKMMLVTKGDACLNFDSPLKGNDIMGKIIAIEKPIVTINLDCKSWRIANYMMARHSLLSLLIYKRICFLKRLVIGNRENRLMHLGSKVLFFSLFPKLLINFLFLMQRLKSKIKPNTV